jgi:hypothetical protein
MEFLRRTGIRFDSEANSNALRRFAGKCHIELA